MPQNKSKLTIDELKNKMNEIVGKYEIKKIILFGSRANGSDREDSDVDLIMEFKNPITLMVISKIRYELEDLLGVEVDIIHGPIQDGDMIEIGKVVELYAA